MRQILAITEQAAKQIHNLLNIRDKESVGVRVRIKTGGCSGYKYVIEYADNIESTDVTVEQHGVKLLVDRGAELFLLGSVMDYYDDKIKSGFTFNNPNQKSSCGCGESFNV